MSDYGIEISKLTARQMRNASPAEAAEVLERLLSSAAFTLAMMSGTDKKLANELLTGAEAHLYEEVARYGRLFRMLPA